MPKKYWIKHAIKGSHRGSLTNWAKKHRLYHDGRICLGCAQAYLVRHPNLHRQRQLNLARTLRRLPHTHGRE